MPDVESAASGGSGNNSSDFVRKLYKMLEEPQYANVVRWGNDGTSFVVLENEKFTKSILPKHFKHSNFASFVRQLNKYDFHKVRHNDDGGQSPYGPDAWEFIHPEFRADRKDNLDNIRRKAPAPRKTQVAEDTYAQTQGQVDVLQQTVQQLSVELTNMRNESYNTIRVLTEEVGRLRKVVTAQSHAIFDLVGFEVEEVARKKREQDEQEGLPPTHSLPVIRTDELPSLLRQARDSSTNVFEDLGESSNELIELAAKYGNDKDKLFDLGPPRNGMGGDPLDDNRFIFPGGMSNGINGRGGFNGEGEAGKIKRKNIWGKRQPIILLVDDNGVHAKYAQRALQRLNCRYDYARNGQEAVRKVNADPGKFDLILMDIIMPYLGGVEATAALRTENYPRMPIIALTTSWKPADVAMYLKHGMDDILAKPYTEDVLEAMLRKYLPKLVRHVKIEDLVSSHDALPTVPAYPKPVPPKPTGTLVINTSLNNSATAAARMDQTPIQSPSTTISWHSPANQLTAVTHGASPTINPGVVNPMVRATQANGMVSITNGVTNGLNGLGGNMSNDMSGSPITNGLSAGGLSGSPLSNASMTNGVMASIEMPMGNVGPPNYAMMNGMGIPGMPVTQRPPFPGMNSGYNHLTVDGGVDFGDERPEKRQRLYAPGEIGGYVSWSTRLFL